MPKEDCKRAIDHITRRRFVAGAAGAVALPVFVPASALGADGKTPASERIGVGLIGKGVMGNGHLRRLVGDKGVRVLGVCDVDRLRCEQAQQVVKDHYGDDHGCTMYNDYRKLIARKDIDAVVIVTPDHWHTIPVMMACDAGKDIWCEKPLTTSIGEGRPLIDAVRRNKRVLQCGNFQRSGPHFQEVVQMVSSGYIGKVARVETWIHDSTPVEGIGNPPNEDPPEGLDWDRYLGWTEKVPYNKNRHIYNFRWFLNYSGGKMTDWGAHLIDIVLWAMGEEKKPKAVTAMGGNFVLQDNRTTPDTLEVLYDFDDYILSFSNRVYNGYVERNRYGILFYGSLGTLYVDRTGYIVTPINDGCEPKKVEGVREGDMNVAHWQNFVDCLKSRKDPISFVESAFNTATVCHMGTTAYVTGGRLEWDAEKERFGGNDKGAAKKANAWAYRPYQNGWSLGTPYYRDWKA